MIVPKTKVRTEVTMFGKLLRILMLMCVCLIVISCGGGESPTETPDEVSVENDVVEDVEQSSASDAEAGETVDEDNVNVEDEADDEGLVINDELMGKTIPSLDKFVSDAPTLGDLVEKYPELADLLTAQDLTDQDTVSVVYDNMVMIYQEEGVAGVQLFLADSGLGEQLGLGDTYIDYLLIYEDEGADAAETLARDRQLINSNNQLRAELVLESNDSSRIEPLLAENRIEVLSKFENRLEIGIPLAVLSEAQSSDEVMTKLVAITQHEDVAGMRTPAQRVKQQSGGSEVTGEGVAVMGGDAWHDAGITGEGVRVAIVDSGFQGFLDAVGTELPNKEKMFIYSGNDAAAMNALSDDVHGFATAEIIHDMAPDAEIVLVDVTDMSIFDYPELLDWLVAQDVDIVSHSMGYPAEPIDGTGFVDAAIDSAEDELLWFNASGNSAQQSLSMTWQDGDDNNFHEWKSDTELLPILLGPGYHQLILHWEGTGVYPDGGETVDLDLSLYYENEDGELEQLLASSAEYQNGSRDSIALEVSYLFTEEIVTIYAAVFKDSDEDPSSRIRLLVPSGPVELALSTPRSSISSPADAESVIAVGATNWRDDELEYYSSQGPTWDGQKKPQLSAPADVSSAAYQSVGEESFPGTSASSPYAAGAAALMLSANLDWETADLREAVLENIEDLGRKGFDYGFGLGRVDLGEPPADAVAAVTPTSEPTDEPEPTIEPTDEPEPTESASEPVVPIVGGDDTDEPEPTEEADDVDEPEPTEEADDVDEPEPTEEADDVDEPEPTEVAEDSDSVAPIVTGSAGEFRVVYEGEQGYSDGQLGRLEEVSWDVDEQRLYIQSSELVVLDVQTGEAEEVEYEDVESYTKLVTNIDEETIALLDGKDYIYIIDKRSGEVITQFGGEGTADEQFDLVKAIQVSNDGALYVYDTNVDDYINRIKQFSLDGVLTAVFEVDDVSGSMMGLDADSNIYLGGYRAIHKYDSSGTLIAELGEDALKAVGRSYRASPRAITVADDGRIILATYEDGVVVLDAAGELLGQYGTPLDDCNDLTTFAPEEICRAVGVVFDEATNTVYMTDGSYEYNQVVALTLE